MDVENAIMISFDEVSAKEADQLADDLDHEPADIDVRDFGAHNTSRSGPVSCLLNCFGNNVMSGQIACFIHDA